MKPLEKIEIAKIMKMVIWDYDIDPLDLYDIVTGKKTEIGTFNKERVLIRMIERLSWYDLINILGIEYLKKNINRELLKHLRFEAIRNKYEFIRKILQGEVVSFSGWSPEYREKIRHTLLSHRRYGP